MSRSTIALSKFVGCISLGLLTGVSYTLSTTHLPSLLLLPSAPLAHSSVLSLRRSARTQQRVLSLVAVASLSLSYLLSPRKGRHPYLLWTALTVGVGQGVEFVMSGKDEDGEGVGGEADMVNGEVVREGVEGWRRGEWVRAGVAGLAWGMSVVGIWGDRF